jgi:hypothetical protein
MYINFLCTGSFTSIYQCVEQNFLYKILIDLLFIFLFKALEVLLRLYELRIDVDSYRCILDQGRN